MPDTREPQTVIDAAEQAAAVGDYTSAERLLREAALLQEASLGPLHADLANTLNNLGIVYEITNKPADAEHAFRRACAIAAAVLEPDHPFVATSRKNLEDFCAARGKPVDSPSPSAIPADRAEPATSSDDLPPLRLSYEEPRPVASRRWTRGPAIGTLIAGGLVLMLIATASWYRSKNDVESSPGGPSVSPAPSPTTTGSPPVGPIASSAPTETGTRRGSPQGPGPKTDAAASTSSTGRRAGESSSLPTAARSGTRAGSVPSPPLVVAAQVCRDLSTGGPRGSSGAWRCVPPGVPVGPGRLYFYTRLKAPTVTTVEHRWYRGDRLRQVVELPIRANATGGYRTYSRQTVDSQGAGDWRVELRSKDGILLHEERFVVR
jgi:hypothetical protein